MANVTVYGIANCDTVKKARGWLDERGVAHEFVDFRRHPVPAPRVADWVERLGSKALRNTSGRSYRALPVEKSDWTEEQWATQFSEDPMLIKRPVIEVDGEPVIAGFRDPSALEKRLE